MFQWIWPSFEEIDDAKKALNNGAGIAFFVALVTGVVTYLQLSGKVKIFEHWSASAYVDAALFAGIGLGLIFRSRIVAIAAVILYGIEQYYMAKTMGGFRFSLVPIVVMLTFVNSARGAFAYHDFKREAKESGVTQEGGETKKKLPRKFLVLIILLIVAALGVGAWFIVPQLKNKNFNVSLPSQLTGNQFKLDGILTDNGQPAVMFKGNGNLVKEGDMHDGYLVKQIGKDFVILEHPKSKKSIRVELFPDLYASFPKAKPAAQSRKEVPAKTASPTVPAIPAVSGETPFPAVNPSVPNPFGNLVALKDETQAMSDMRQIQSAASVLISMDERTITLQKMAERNLISKELASGETGTYVYNLNSVNNEFEITADPAKSDSNLRHFLIDRKGNIHAQQGSPATEESPRP